MPAHFVNGWTDTGDLPCREALRCSLASRRIDPADATPRERLHVHSDSSFIDFSGFEFTPLRRSRWAECQVYSPCHQSIAIEATTCGGLWLWVGTEQVLRHEPYTRNSETSIDATLTVMAGTSRWLLWLDELHERDTHSGFRITLRDGKGLAAGVETGIDKDALVKVSRVMRGLSVPRYFHTDGVVALQAAREPEVALTLDWLETPAAGVHASTATLRRDTGRGPQRHTLTVDGPDSRIDLMSAAECQPGCLIVDIRARIGDLEVQRRLGTTIATRGQWLDADDVAARKAQARQLMLQDAHNDPTRLVVLLHHREHIAPCDLDALLERCLAPVLAREDCSDFWVVPLCLAWLTGADRLPGAGQLRQALLDWRYWFDEPGNDVMWFWSENHALCFHVAQYLAGGLFPDERFSASGRSGVEQQQIAAERLARWFDAVEPHGFVEWNSAAYYPIDLVGLLVLYEMAPASTLRDRTRRLLDRLFAMMALHTLGGVPAGSQGRAYEKELLAGPLTELAPVCAIAFGGPWYPGFERAAGLFSVSSYEPPAALNDWVAMADGKRLQASYRQGVDSRSVIRLWKCASVQLSAVCDHHSGEYGHQQHVVDVQMRAHAFARFWINHPGELQAWSDGRPSFLAGNGVLPRVAMHENLALLIYDISARRTGHADFTQFFCPAEVLDEVRHVVQADVAEGQGSWLFARGGYGALGVWAASGLVRADGASTTDTGTWRQPGDAAAWCLVVDALPPSSAPEQAFDAFVAACLARQPHFDSSRLELSLFDGHGAALKLSTAGPLCADARPVPNTPVLSEPSVALEGDDWRLWSAW